jgi:hypothetical protein
MPLQEARRSPRGHLNANHSVLATGAVRFQGIAQSYVAQGPVDMCFTAAPGMQLGLGGCSGGAGGAGSGEGDVAVAGSGEGSGQGVGGESGVAPWWASLVGCLLVGCLVG